MSWSLVILVLILLSPPPTPFPYPSLSRPAFIRGGTLCALVARIGITVQAITCVQVVTIRAIGAGQWLIGARGASVDCDFEASIAFIVSGKHPIGCACCAYLGRSTFCAGAISLREASWTWVANEHIAITALSAMRGIITFAATASTGSAAAQTIISPIKIVLLWTLTADQLSWTLCAFITCNCHTI